MTLKLNHTNLFMNEVSSFVFKKFRSILVGMWRKVVFGDKNPDLCCDDKKKWF